MDLVKLVFLSLLKQFCEKRSCIYYMHLLSDSFQLYANQQLLIVSFLRYLFGSCLKLAH